jgi:hypothetical protein
VSIWLAARPENLNRHSLAVVEMSRFREVIGQTCRGGPRDA